MLQKFPESLGNMCGRQRESGLGLALKSNPSLSLTPLPCTPGITAEVWSCPPGVSHPCQRPCGSSSVHGTLQGHPAQPCNASELTQSVAGGDFGCKSPCWVSTHSPIPRSIQVPHARDSWRALLWAQGGTSWGRRAIHAFGVPLGARIVSVWGYF